jgi:hypothetical protein
MGWQLALRWCLLHIACRLARITARYFLWTQTDGWKYVMLNLALGQLHLSYTVRSGNHISGQLGHFVKYALRKLGQYFNDNLWNKWCCCLVIICYRQKPRQPLYSTRIDYTGKHCHLTYLPIIKIMMDHTGQNIVRTSLPCFLNRIPWIYVIIYFSSYLFRVYLRTGSGGSVMVKALRY